ncbi:MAG TPA: hypothetical protein VE710_02750 [Candidatus Bathyarchaeia archaeon]|nr:hypothetical protein [Candidatus Bathyarchaeia archaeon]
MKTSKHVAEHYIWGEGIAHQARNDHEQDVEFLVISHPTTRGDRFEVTSVTPASSDDELR